MKSLKFLLFALLVAFTACKKTDNDIQPSLSINPVQKELESGQGNFLVAVTSNVKWTASTDKSWLSLSPVSGTGDGTIQVEYQINTSATPRTAVITFKGSSLEDKYLTVTQSGVSPFLTVTPQNQNVSAAAGSTKFAVSSNTNWIVSSDPLWCTLSQTSGTGNAELTATYQENTLSTQRTATLTFKVTGLADQYATVTQAAFVPSLFVSPSNQNVVTAAGSTTFNVASNINWTAESDTNWCTINTSGTGNGTINANFTENTSFEPRIAKITVTGEGVSSQEVKITQAAAWVCGLSTLNIEHKVTGGVSPVYKTVTYGTVTNIPGEVSKCWITSNLGADHQANSVDDAIEASAGWYWQFNRKQGFKHDGTTRTPATAWISSISETSDWISANDPCNIELGSSWRLPTYDEWYNVDVNGSWTSWTGPWNSGLKLHAAGYLRYSDGSLRNRGSNGNYWSSSLYSSAYGWDLSFGSGNCHMIYTDYKANAFSIRCLRD